MSDPIPNSPAAPTLEAALELPLHRALIRSLAAAPKNILRPFTRWPFWVLALSGLLCGLLLPGRLGGIFKPEVVAERTASATIAASFALNLLALAVAFCLLPGANSRRSFDFFSGWLRGALWTGLAFWGLKISAGPGLSFSFAMELAALTAAYQAALIGAAALLEIICRPRVLIGRMLLVLAVVFCTGGIFWTKPLIQYFKRLPTQGLTPEELAERSVDRSWAATATEQGVLTLSPTMGLASAWNTTSTGFDLLKAGETYNVWIGSYDLLSYPPLWPFDAKPQGAAEGETMRAPGLVLGIGLWGLLLICVCDLLLSATPRPRPAPETSSLPAAPQPSFAPAL